ncbi:hypothetical protein HDU98_009938 [Podochytrium sp. JEL0797]|nr:hypothetical protein HDU98_009938 [Podochytrium sp. JEL0797]
MERAALNDFVRIAVGGVGGVGCDRDEAGGTGREERRVEDVFAVRGGFDEKEFAEAGEDDVEGEFFGIFGGRGYHASIVVLKNSRRCAVHSKRKEMHSPDGHAAVSKRGRFGDADACEEKKEEVNGKDNWLDEDSACGDDDSDVEEDADA